MCLCLNGSSNKTPGSFTQWPEPYKTLLNELSGGWLHSGADLQGRAGKASGTSWNNSYTGVSQAKWKGLVKAAASGAVFPNILESTHFNLAQAWARFQIAGVGSLAGHFIAKLEKKIGMLWLTLLFTYRSHSCSQSFVPAPLALLSGLCHHYWDSLAFSDVAPSIQMKLSLLGGTT